MVSTSSNRPNSAAIASRIVHFTPTEYGKHGRYPNNNRNLRDRPAKTSMRIHSRILSSFTAATLFIGTNTATAAPAPFDCPVQIPLTSQSLASAPAGWEATTAGTERIQHALTGFAVNGGPVGTPNGEIYDKEEERRDGKGGITSTLRWNLRGMTGGVAVCSYFLTRVELVRSLDGYSSCEVVSKRSQGSAFKMVSATCR